MYEINKLAPTVSVKMANMGVLCAVFIVLLHSGCGGMTRVAVPYFFLAAGYFLAGHIGETGWWHREVAKRVQSLLVPMWIWGAVSIMIELLLQWGIRLTGYDYHGESLSFLYRLLKSLGVLFTVNMGVLWFVRMLFFLVVISPLLRGGGKSVNLLRLMIFAGLYGWFELSDLEQGALWNFFEYGFSLRGLLYFSVGIYLRQYPIRLNISKLSLVVLVVVSGALVGFNVTALIMVPVCIVDFVSANAFLESLRKRIFLPDLSPTYGCHADFDGGPRRGWHPQLDLSRGLACRPALRCLSCHIHFPHPTSPPLCPTFRSIGFRRSVTSSALCVSLV